MLSAVITALLFIVMLLIVASFVIGALSERQRHLQSQAAPDGPPTQNCKGSQSDSDRPGTAGHGGGSVG